MKAYIEILDREVLVLLHAGNLLYRDMSDVVIRECCNSEDEDW